MSRPLAPARRASRRAARATFGERPTQRSVSGGTSEHHPIAPGSQPMNSCAAAAPLRGPMLVTVAPISAPPSAWRIDRWPNRNQPAMTGRDRCHRGRPAALCAVGRLTSRSAIADRAGLAGPALRRSARRALVVGTPRMQRARPRRRSRPSAPSRSRGAAARPHRAPKGELGDSIRALRLRARSRRRPRSGHER
jgi:hypothetical protein